MQETNSPTLHAKFERAFESLKPREQLLLFVGIPATIIVVGFLLFIEPMLMSTNALDEKVTRLNKQLDSAQQSTAELLVQASIDPNTEVKQQIASLEQQLAKLNTDFEGELNQLVAPQAMPVLLEQLFDKADGLALVSMRSIAPLVLFGDKEGGNEQVIYQHGIEITIEGSFFATRDFLASAENLEWKLYWQNLQYQVGQHPKATTTLSLFTLSTSEAFIGVY
jgi:MSHA biogenesis protein MshJ